MSIVIFTNNYENIFKFRLELIRLLYSKFPSSKIILLGSFDGYESKLPNFPNNVLIKKINLSSRNLNIANNIHTLFSLLIFYIKIRPKLVLSFTIKPNLFSSILKFFFNFKLITNITGLGDIFINENNFFFMIRKIYIFYLRFSDKIVCQHISDYNFISSKFKKSKEKLIIIKGSGVNHKLYRYNPARLNFKKITFLFIGRIIREKGIIEFLNAVIKFNRMYPRKANFTIIGSKYPNNSLNKQFDVLVTKSKVNYISQIFNIKDYLLNSSFLVLPSYREGVSKVIIESLSLGKPVITSDTIGCKDVIQHGYNGFLTSKGSKDSIFRTLENSYHMKLDEYKIMSKNCYLSSKQYSSQKINFNYYKMIDSLGIF